MSSLYCDQETTVDQSLLNELEADTTRLRDHAHARNAGSERERMDDLLKRISADPAVCHGTPCIRGTRIMVWQIIQFLANGDTEEQILSAYPVLTAEDIRACLTFAAELARERVLPVEPSS
jgi:uncharacterized protein (DUF433 family)